MKLKSYGYHTPEPNSREYPPSLTRPGQGFRPGEWMRRLKAGTATQLPPGRFGIVKTEDMAKAQRMDLDITDRAKMVAERIVPVSRRKKIDESIPAPVDTEPPVPNDP